MKVIEETAKKVDDAIHQGLVKLGATLDEVNVEVLESGGLFRKAKVRLTLERDDAPAPVAEQAKPEKAAPAAAEKPNKPVKSEQSEKSEKSEKNVPAKADKPVKPDKPEKADKPEKSEKPIRSDKPEPSVKPEKKDPPHAAAPRKRSEEDKAAAAHALEFVKEMVKKMGFEDAEVKADADNEMIEITAPAGDDSLIIGRHGETLIAMSYLAETCARAEKCHINVTVDCNGYRDRRAASLTALARRRADECVNKRRKIKLEPMERVDRRTVHNALNDDERVSTASEGKEPYRCVVIIPKKNNNN